MLDRDLVERGADVLATAIAVLFEAGVDAAASSEGTVEVLDTRLAAVREIADDVRVLATAVVVLVRRLRN